MAWAVLKSIQAGPRRLSPEALARAVRIFEATRDDPGPGWQRLGSKTTAKGLDLRFDADDDPQAEAMMMAPGAERSGGGTFAHGETIRLAGDFETHHVHTRGFVARVRLRGTGRVVGREIRLLMKVANDRTPVGVGIENDDDTDAAVGDWIEIESVEILEVR